MEKNKKRISFIIPTYNRSLILVETLICLEKQIDKKDDEVVIIEDGSLRAESNKVKKFIKNKNFYKYIYKKNEGPAKARNMAIKESQGNILVFLNDDSLIKDGYVSEQIRFHKIKSEDCALVGRFDENPKLIKTPLMKWLVKESGLHFTYIKNKEIMPWYYFWTGNLSLKKSFLTKNRLWFDQDFKVAAWEDVEFGYRAKEFGLKIYFKDEVNAYHNHYFEYKDIMSRYFSHGRGMYTVTNKLSKEYLPMLAKNKYRWMARLILMVTVYPMTKYFLEKWYRIEDHPNNLLMQYLIVGEKIKGWDYEKSL